jgi:hypothetical protein
MIGQDGQGTSGQGHPLPDSEEAREQEIPEHLVREKGHGDDAHDALQPAGDPVAPDGESYEIRRDQAKHQDRGQGFAEGPGRG